MQTYAGRKRNNTPAPQERTAENISKSEMLRVSGAGAPQPMSPALREKFEPGFGADFSNIRISRGHIPEELGVQAVAKGTDILLDSRAGMDVLGHELAHVVQQAQGRVAGGFPVVHDSALEHEADVMGARAASGESAMAGGMSGFGGGMMSIAPMSGDSAPAQCKLGRHKNKERPPEMEPANFLGAEENPAIDEAVLEAAGFPAVAESAAAAEPAPMVAPPAAPVVNQNAFAGGGGSLVSLGGPPVAAQAPRKRSLGDRIRYHRSNLDPGENGTERGLFRMFHREPKGNIL